MPEMAQRMFHERGTSIEEASSNLLNLEKGAYKIASPTMLMAYLYKLTQIPNELSKGFDSAESELILQIISAVFNLDIYISQGASTIRLRTYEYENAGLWAPRYVSLAQGEAYKEVSSSASHRHWIWLERSEDSVGEVWSLVGYKGYGSVFGFLGVLPVIPHQPNLSSVRAGSVMTYGAARTPSKPFIDEHEDYEVEHANTLSPSSSWQGPHTPSPPISTGPGKNIW